MDWKLWLTLSALLTAQPAAWAGVVLNEIFYRAPDAVSHLQWIEIHNASTGATDVSGWKLANAVEFQFPSGTVIAPNGFAVVCQDRKAFGEFYDTVPVGEFKKSLKRRGETIDLVDATGRRVDRVRFSNEAPWPMAADGHTASLERISPAADGSIPGNWASSPLSADEKQPAGTPGRINASHSDILPPVVTEVTFSPAQPGPKDKLLVRASVADPEGVTRVELRYQRVETGRLAEEKAVAMQSAGGASFTGEIPAQPAGTLLRFRVRAVNSRGGERFYPDVNELRPALSVFIPTEAAAGRIPLAYVVNTDPKDAAEAARYRARARRGGTDPFANPKWRDAEGQLLSGTALSGLWTELTLNQPIDYATYRRLREVVAKRASERERLLEEFSGSTDLDAGIAAVPAKVSAFQARVRKDIQEALPPGQRDAFASWYATELKARERGPNEFIRNILKIEGGWLALNNRLELSEGQIAAARPVLKKGIEARAAHVPTLQKVFQGQHDFGEFQSAIGKVERELNADLTGALSGRQFRLYRQWQREHGGFIRPRLTDPPPLGPRGRSAFVVVDPASGRSEVFDFVNVTSRSAGYKARLHKDQLYHGMSTVNIIFEYNDRFVLAEPLAFDFYRRVGAPASQTEFVRFHLDGEPIGYHLLFEQVNRSFLRRNRINSDGDLYKLIWYGSGLEGQHERQNDPDGSHAALSTLVNELNTTKGDAQWAVIEKNFNLDEVINYFAVNMCLSHWDGFFNNYFAYHDRKGSGKWEMYPWDQDKTWGFHDSIKGGEIFVDMPLTFGMEGDRPPGGGEPRFNPGHWWRPGGYFSKPLLANSEFRRRFLLRTREILEKHYTPSVMGPVIGEIAEQLRPEVPIRARAIGEEPSEALKRFDANLTSLKDHLVRRREFLLNQTEIKNLPVQR